MAAQGAKDSGKLVINMNSFVGGESIDFKNGVANAFYKQEALDFRSKASQMSVLPGAAAVSGASSVLVDLPVEMVQDPTGVRWILGDQGNLYQLAVNNTLTKVATCTDNSGYGMVYNQLSDMLYITGKQTVSMYGPLTTGGSPTLSDQQFAKSASSANGVVNLYQTTTTNYDGSARNNIQSIATTQGVTATSQVSTNTAATYAPPTTISETATAKCPFAPDLEPFYSIAIYVNTVGTGNLTLTLHDGFNRSLAAITINHASLTTGYNEFVFAAPGIRSFTGAIQSGLSAAYHWHATSSVASDAMRIQTLTANDLSTADMILFNYRLVKTNNGLHPAAIFTGSTFLLCVGNGQYLTTYNFSNDSSPSNNVWQRERFPIDAGFEICGLSQNNQYLVIAAEKRSSSTARQFQEGALYFWDGQNASYIFKISLPMGAPYSIYTFNNVTYFIAAGALYAWGGGQQVIKVRPIAYQNTDYLGTTDNTIAYPNMMAPRYNILLMGYPSATTNANIKCGVYSFGSVELVYPNSFGYSYALSSGIYNWSSANALRIGMIKNFVDTLYIASVSTTGGTTTYQLDTVTPTSTPAGTFSWDSLIWDGGARYKQKEAMRLKISFLPWPSGATLTAYYAFERGSKVTADPTSGHAFSPAVGDTELVVEIDKRFYEGQWGFAASNSGATVPATITAVAMEIDPLGSESDIRLDAPEGGQ